MKKFIFLSLSLFIFLSLVMLMRGGSQFYEGGAYVAYAKSMFFDFDFNIINQLPERAGWLITKKFYHPDFHSEIQTPFLVFIYLFENALNFLNFKITEGFYLTTFTLNFLITLVSLKLIEDYAKELGFIFSRTAFLIFSFSTVFLYFSFFTSTVIDVFIIPLLIYCLLIHQQSKDQEKDINLWSYGFTLGLLHSAKSLYTPIVVFLFLAQTWKLLKKKDFHSLIALSFSFAFIFICNLFNQYIKYGDTITPHVGLRFLFDYSVLRMIVKFFHSFLGFGGMFYINPLFILSFVGAFLLARKLYQNRKLNLLEIVVFALWTAAIFFHTLILVGFLSEDHLPGRTSLSASVFLLLGFSYFFDLIKNKKIKFTLSFILISWGLIHIFSFVLIDLDDSYNFSNIILPSIDYLGVLLEKFKIHASYNLRDFLISLPSIAVFSLIWGGIITFLTRYKPQRIMNVVMIIAALIFSGMTLSNWHFGQKHIQEMKSMNAFNNKVIGKGPEIYFFDYFFDYYYSVKVTSDEKTLNQLQIAKSQYFKAIKPQIEKSTPAFSEIVNKEADDYSFWRDHTN